jgi:hypothetical protein
MNESYLRSCLAKLPLHIVIVLCAKLLITFIDDERIRTTLNALYGESNNYYKQRGMQ